MSVIDVESLLQEVSAEQPCGEDLEYDPLFQQLEQAAMGKPDTQFSAAEPPDWREVKAKALELLERSRDLRATIQLARAYLYTDGWPGFSAALKLAAGLLEKYWDHVYPQLDPDDGDPTFRVNSIAALCDLETMLRNVRDAPLVRSRAVGQFSLRQIETAQGKVPAIEGEEVPDPAAIDAAFLDIEPEELLATASAIEDAINSTQASEQILTERLGATEAPDLSDFVDVLREAQQIVTTQIAARGLSDATADEGDGSEAEGDTPAAAIRGEITNRDDVVRMLDKIRDYYRRHEPSSPVPLILQRAKRLVAMDFRGIVQDIAPDGLNQANFIFGPDEEEQPTE